MQRRQFLKLSPIAAVAGASVAVPGTVVKGSAMEIQTGKRYIMRMRIKDPLPEEIAQAFGQALQIRGFDVTVVSGDFDLFEVEGRK